MPDNADIATSNIEREERSREAQRRIERARRPAVSARECVDCGGAISERRREASPGCQRCLECQHDFDRLRARRLGV